MSGSPVRRSDVPDASQSEICKQLARVVLDFAKPVYLTPPASRGIGIIIYKDPRHFPSTCPPEYDLMVTESQVWVRTAERYKTPTDVVIMALDRFEDFLGLHAPTRWYKYATRVSNDICIRTSEPCKRAELVRHVRAVAKLAGGIRVLQAKKD